MNTLLPTAANESGLQATHPNEGRWTSRKPFTFTDNNLSLLNRRGGCQCVLCTKRFRAGDQARWIYCNSTPGQCTGNFFVCSECDDGDDDSMRAKGKANLEAVTKSAKAWGIQGCSHPDVRKYIEENETVLG